MRANLMIFVLACSVAFGQGQADGKAAEVFHLHHIDNKRDLNEFAKIIRNIADRSTGIVPNLSAACCTHRDTTTLEATEDAVGMTLSVKGTPIQIAIADWLVTELDQRTLPPFSTPEFKVPNKEDDVVRVFFLSHTATIQDFQEIATSIRVIVEIPRTFTFNAPKALVVRGTADQLATTEFLVRELDQAADAKRTDSRQYQMIDDTKRSENEVRVFYLPYASTVQQFQRAATAVRTIVEVRRVFTYNAPRALVIRGSADQVAATAWLVHELGKPVSPGTLVSDEHNIVDLNHQGEDVMRVFYVSDVSTVAGLTQVADQIKTVTMMRRVFPYPEMKAIVLRGTAGNVTIAEQILKDRQIASQ